MIFASPPETTLDLGVHAPGSQVKFLGTGWRIAAEWPTDDQGTADRRAATATTERRKATQPDHRRGHRQSSVTTSTSGRGTE